MILYFVYYDVLLCHYYGDMSLFEVVFYIKDLCFVDCHLAFGLVYIVIESPHMIVHLKVEFLIYYDACINQII